MEPASHWECLILILEQTYNFHNFFCFFSSDKLCAFYWHNCDTGAETPVT